MTEYVFRPSRRLSGKRVFSRLFSGRYSIVPGEKVQTVPLRTPDERVARKRLRDIIVDKQLESEGMIAPSSIRDARTVPIHELVAGYARNLRAQHLDEKHIHDTLARLLRVIKETGWLRVDDFQADAFSTWRGAFEGSAKTLKEYQISVNAFLNWLVRVDKLERNRLAKVESIDTRGKQVRPYRAFTEAEVRKLLAVVTPERRVAYLVLLYTGQRRSEIAALVMEDLNLGETPEVRIRIETTKDKDKRTIALHPMLAEELRSFVPLDASPTDLVFPNFPSYDALRADLHRAKVERRDALGRVVHFHSFRKTWQTLGVRFNMSQRVAQEVLGHSDPALTANVYTDIAAVGMHSEIAKLPWYGGNAQIHAQDGPKDGLLATFQKMIGDLVGLLNTADPQAFAAALAGPGGPSTWLPGLGSNQRPSD